MDRYRYSPLIRRGRLFCGILTLLVINLSSSAYSVINDVGKNSASVVTDGEFIPDEVIVKFRSDLKTFSTDSIHSRIGTTRISDISQMNAQLVRIKSGATVEKTVALYSEDPNVEFAQPNFIYRASIIPNDPS
ncbi:MAG: hypothetical protein HY999_00405, partial [Nitrospinae bacterium]|nr:hypothetical protein [Nitrospinota bacterium]